jgi:hypothetical protein
MKVNKFSKPLDSKALNESLAKKFGKKLDIERFTTEELMDARNKVRTIIRSIETNESYNSPQTEKYQRNKLILDVLNKAIAERNEHIVDGLKEAIISQLNEGPEGEAEVIMAAKDMVDKVTNWLENTAQMQSESVLHIKDAVRDEMSQEKSDQFSEMVNPALERIHEVLAAERENLVKAVRFLAGEDVFDDDMVGDDDMEGDEDMDIGGDEADPELPDLDDFEADSASAGDDEPTGRQRRESVEYGKSSKVKKK